MFEKPPDASRISSTSNSNQNKMLQEGNDCLLGCHVPRSCRASRLRARLKSCDRLALLITRKREGDTDVFQPLLQAATPVEQCEHVTDKDSEHLVV